MADTTTQPFVWGPGGEAMTIGELQRRKVADALIAAGTSNTPLPAGTRGAGVWTQGLSRIAQAMLGAYEEREDDQSAKANDANTTALLESNPMLQSAPAAAPAASASLPVAAAPSANTSGKIYSNDEPSPLDPPSGADRAAMVATALGEEKAGSPEGLGVINTMRNRAIDGGFGGDTPLAVATAPQQYSPWNDPAGRARMSTAMQDPAAVAKVSDQIDQAYGTGAYVNAGPNDPTAGKTHFYDPQSMTPANATPSWAQGKPFQTIGNTRFLDNPDTPAAAPAPGTGLARVGTALANGTAAAQAAAPVAAAQSPIPPHTQGYIKSLLANPQTRAAGVQLLGQYAARQPKETYSQQTDADGNVWSVNNATGQRTVALQATKDPTSVQEYQFYTKNLPAGQPPMDYSTWSTAKARAGATNVTTNVDPNAGATYDKTLTEGLAKSHAALSNGVEDAQARARAYAQMQGSVDAIQKGGGTTGGLAPEQRLTLMKSANAAAATLGLSAPFNENDISDKELLAKSGRQLAGNMAKSAMGSRVTNFEMANFLNANPGLAMSTTGNQRLIGIGSQIANRDVAVGQAIRQATAQAVSKGQKIDPVTVQKIIDDYDQAHHISDPVTGQDLTGSYVLPEFQTQGTNAALAVGHTANINGIQIRRVN